MYVSWIIKKIEYLSLSKNQLHAKSEKNSDKPLEHIYLCARIGRFKGQEISEWKYWVVPLPKIWTKKLEKFVPILGNATNSYFHSEISWPLA